MRFLVILLVLSGCAAQKPIEIPINVLCKIPVIEKPDYYFDHATKDMSTFDKVKLLIADRYQRQGYEGELEAASKVCQ